MNDNENITTEIVIIGGGGSGLATAVSAAEKGAEVLVIEKRSTLGGNSSMAGGIFAAESHTQKRRNIDISKDSCFKAAMDHAHWKINPRIIRTIIDRSGDTIRWLEEKGIKLEIPVFYPDLPETTHIAENKGAGVVNGLVKSCNELGVRLMKQTRVKKILIGERGNIEGVLVESKKKTFIVSAKAAIIATGGYAGNRRLLKKYFPFYSESLHVIGLPHKGDGLLMTSEIGAATEGLGILHLRGPYFPGALECVVAAMQPNTVWINKNGERFVDESKAFYWPEAANALNMQPEKISYTLFDNKLKDVFIDKGIILSYGSFRNNARLTELVGKIKLEEEKGHAKISESWDEIAEWIGASPSILKNSINEYNNSCDQQHDGLFVKGPKYLLPLRTPPYYALKCAQGFFGTIGGIKINHRMEVINVDGEPIPGLYAVGNDTGGWESDTYSLGLPGMTFGFAINSGRIAGENAVEYNIRL